MRRGQVYREQRDEYSRQKEQHVPRPEGRKLLLACLRDSKAASVAGESRGPEAVAGPDPRDLKKAPSKPAPHYYILVLRGHHPYLHREHPYALLVHEQPEMEGRRLLCL